MTTTTDKSRTKSATVYLDERDGKIVVTPQDNDRFVMTRKEAVRACQEYVHGRVSAEDDILEQFDYLLKILGKWIRVHQQKIARACLTRRDGGLFFLVVQNRMEYDEDIIDDLSDLLVSIATDALMDLIQLDGMVIPNVSAEGISTFIGNFSMEYENVKAG